MFLTMDSTKGRERDEGQGREGAVGRGEGVEWRGRVAVQGLDQLLEFVVS